MLTNLIWSCYGVCEHVHVTHSVWQFTVATKPENSPEYLVTYTDLELVRFTSFDQRFNKAASVIEVNIFIDKTVNNQKSTFPVHNTNWAMQQTDISTHIFRNRTW